MTNEEKELLLKDLCVRLPYGVIIHTFAGDFRLLGIDEDNAHLDAPVYEEGDDWFTWEHGCKPYLRPMESMNRVEVLEYISLKESIVASDGITYSFETYKSIDWLNKNKFDYRGLIPMGLALPATKGMYNIK